MADVHGPMQIVFFGSGAFGLPTLEHLARHSDRFTIGLIVSQPDRPAGRRQRLTPTPVSQWAAEHAVARITTSDVNAPAIIAEIAAQRPDALVVIAFGQKIGPALIDGRFAINLHGSLLPAYRGAAPIQRAMMDGCTTTGVSVIALAQRMDAGDILAAESTPIDPKETAGELHDRLALLGAAAVARVLEAHRRGELRPVSQDEPLATRAPKLRKEEGTTDFNLPAAKVRARIHGVTPWPGCRVALDGAAVRLLRVRDYGEQTAAEPPGTVCPDRRIACAAGTIEVIEIQPEGGRAMTLDAFRNGRPFEPGMRLRPLSLA